MEIHPSILLFAMSAGFTPGPNNIMMMASGLNFGPRRSLPHFLGICFGFPTMFLALGFGLGFVFTTYPTLHELIKIAGILYLLWLAWLIANAAPNETQTAQAKPLTFIQGALFQWVNPKAWVMGSSAIATYTTSGTNLSIQILQIALVFFIFTFPCAGSWLLFGHTLKRIISNTRQQVIFNVVMAILLLASVTPIALETALKLLNLPSLG